MPDMKYLAEMVDRASHKHNNASGRQLAKIAEADGYEVSHSTLNKIRAGTYTSDPSPSTLRAIAHLAAVPEHKLLARFTDPAEIEHSELERAFVEWLNAWYQLQNRTLDYARLRGIDFSAAEAELPELRDMFEEVRTRTGRRWTPPWNPGPEFEADEQPWTADFWNTTTAVPSPSGGHTYRFGRTYDLSKLRESRAETARAAAVWADDERRQAMDYYAQADNGSANDSKRPGLAEIESRFSELDMEVENPDDRGQGGA